MIALILKMLAYAATQTLSLFQDLLLAVAVLLVLTAAAVKAHARHALPGRSKDRQDSRRAPCVLLVHTAAAGS